MTLVTLVIAAILTCGVGGVAPGPVREARIEATPHLYALPVEPLYAGGEVSVPGAYVEQMDRERMAYIHGQLTDQRREAAIQHLSGYMRSAGFVEGLVATAPLQYDLAVGSGNDWRMFAVTSTAESSGGRVCCGSFNPIGALGMSFNSWEGAVTYYYRRISEFGFSGDCWSIARYWYGGGSSMGGKAEQYADNIVGAVQTIPSGFGGGGSSAE